MAHAGDSYTEQLQPAHLGWGNHRYTNTRDIIYGEGYIPIPKYYARAYDIFNSNHSPVGLGFNLFNASSLDGYLDNITLLAQGSSTAGDIYAKQFSVRGNLKIIGAWYESQNATPNDSIRVTWTSPTHIILELI